MMYLAHYIRNGGRVQSLSEHSNNVAILCRKYGELIGFSNLAELCGLLHDMGKAKAEFQNYLVFNDISRQGKINHSSAGAKYLYETYTNSKSVLDKAVAQIAAIVICSHHSGLIDCINIHGEDCFNTRINPDINIHFEDSRNNYLTKDIEKRIDQLFTASCNELNAIFQKTPKTESDPKHLELKFRFGLLTRYLLSAVIDADRFDTFCFYTQRITEDNADYTNWDGLCNTLDKELAKFPVYNKISEKRQEISNKCKEFATMEKGIYRLYVPTGGGKTLSSLRFALEHAKYHNMSRIIYVIPFTTIIDQNAEVIHNILKLDDIILEHHSNIIRENTDETADEVNKINLLTERWDAPIILTTTVQMLNTLFLGKTSSVRRMHNLANSVLIFDEVQSIPAKLLNLFNTAMNFLSEICGSTIILCTATQPELSSLPHPIRLSEPSEIISNLDDVFVAFKRVKIHDCLKTGGYSSQDLADFVLEKENNILVILNTKKAALNLYQEIRVRKQEADIYYLSTSLCPAHRMNILHEIIEKLKCSSKPVICISTQLIEAGVDISFDVVIRSLAGLDSIAQAAGRCNRHGLRSFGDVYIINSNEENLRMLPEIQRGQTATKRVMTAYSQNPDIFNNDLLSPASIQLYYQYYYAEFSTKGTDFEYPVAKENWNCSENFTLYDLLSENQIGWNAAYSKPQYIFHQAFATAGDIFSVIDQDTISAIAPYEDGIVIIEKLKSSQNLIEIKQLLRKAQRYTINLFINKNKSNIIGIRQINDFEIFEIDETVYSQEFGYAPNSGVS